MGGNCIVAFYLLQILKEKGVGTLIFPPVGGGGEYFSVG